MASAPASQPGLQPHQQNDFYVPAYRVLLNGKVQQQLVQDILSVTFHDSLTEVDSVDLVVNNWDPGDPVKNAAVQGAFRYHNSNIFDPGQEIEVQMGYYRQGKADFQQMMLGKISSMAPNFPASGASTLTVRVLSLLHQFRTKQKTMTFNNKTDSAIAQQIVQEIDKDVHSPGAGKKIPNIKIQMSDKEVKENIKQNNEKPWPHVEMHNQYPIVFLMQRSREIGYDISLDDETDPKTGLRTVTFHYRLSKSVLRPTYTLVWGSSLISFQPTLQTARQVDAVTVNGWNVQTKQPISQTVKRADLAKKGVKFITPQDLGLNDSPVSEQREIVVDLGLKDPNEAKQIAERTLLQISQETVEAKGKTIGVPNLRAGAKVKICMNQLDVSNVPTDRFSGIYQMTETTHTFSDSGYTTDFSCRMESKTDV